MKPFSPIFGIPLGISVSFWTVMGILRLITKPFNFDAKNKNTKNLYEATDIAVIIPAHNEEVVIRRCVQALKLSLPVNQIYVVSDGSVDKTYENARKEKCHVSKLSPGRGKAKALLYLLETHKLFEKYKLIFIVDSDTQIDKDFVPQALKIFKNPKIGVVFGSVRIGWEQHIIPRRRYYFISYRERLNRFLQYFFTYGQTWIHSNVAYVIPGFATIYKSSILSKLPLDTPGILIEDFNLAFQVNKNQICKIGYTPAMIGWDQHPDNLKDYYNQVKRWNIGFFQTIRKNGVWPSFFWLTLIIFTIEVFFNSIFTLLLPLVLFLLLLPYLQYLSPFFANLYQFLGTTSFFYGHVHLINLIIWTFLFDYLFTVVIGLLNKKPQFIIYGLFFIFLHWVTSMIFISSIIPGLRSKSTGQWSSPRRYTYKM